MSKVCHCGCGVYDKDQLAGVVWWEVECPNANVMTVCPTAAAFISQGWFWVSGPPVPSSPSATTPAVQGAQAGLSAASIAAQQIANTQTQPTSPQLPGYSYQYDPISAVWRAGKVAHPATAPERPECQLCGVEMSSYLDAYHGRDAWEAAKCARCRKR